MRYRTLGRTGLTVSRLILGTASFGDTVDEQASRAVVHAAFDAGVTTFDTADVYSGARSEQLLGAALRGVPRDRVVLCSKVGLTVGDHDADHARALAGGTDHAERWTRGISPNDGGLSRKHITSAVEASLSRLGTDYLDLYQVHRFDPRVPLHETLRALDDLVRQGKVRYLGCSGFAAWQLYQALWTSDRMGTARMESIQSRYNLGAREPERDLFPAAEAAGVGVLAYQVLAGGVLAGRASSAEVPAVGRASRPSVAGRYANAEFRDRATRIRSAVEDLGMSGAAACVAWALSQPAVTAAVVATSSPEQLKDLLVGVDARGQEPLLERLAEVAGATDNS